MFYVADSKGFLTWISQFPGKGTIHSQPDIRYAHPFETFEAADSAAKDFAHGAYAVLTTTIAQVPRSAVLKQQSTDVYAGAIQLTSYIKARDLDVHRVERIENRIVSVSVVITDALAARNTWPKFMLFEGVVLIFDCQMAIPSTRAAHSTFGAAYYTSRHEYAQHDARERRETLYMR